MFRPLRQVAAPVGRQTTTKIFGVLVYPNTFKIKLECQDHRFKFGHPGGIYCFLATYLEF